MFPLPPLDGGRIAVGLLPNFLALPLSRLERYGMAILIGLIIILPLVGSQTGFDLSLCHGSFKLHRDGNNTRTEIDRPFAITSGWSS